MTLNWLYHSNGLFTCILTVLWVSHTVVLLLKRPKILFGSVLMSVFCLIEIITTVRGKDSVFILLAGMSLIVLLIEAQVIDWDDKKAKESD